MRLAAVLRPLAVLAFFAFALTAYVDPSLFAGAHARAAEGLLWPAISFFAIGCAARLTLPVSLFGLHWEVSAPLFLALAAPYFLRLLFWRAAGRMLSAPLLPPSAPLAPPAPRPPAPYALPARVAVALTAAARARK